MWIDSDTYGMQVGQVGFLVKTERHERGMPTRRHLQSRPAHTNMSNEPRLTGWCGTTNNVATFAEGLARVVRIAQNGRALVERVKPTRAVLKSLGYPDLAD
jgi:hypothetical protein